MSGGSRKSGGSPDHRKRMITLSVLGLSGTESTKGQTGVGKSLLCNRLVRPHYNDFVTQHITNLSQADFCSPVINQEHWLYFGDVMLDSTDYGGPTQQIRVIEHTVFLDDESFEPLGGSSRLNDYLQRATKVEFETRNKRMYICPDQLGQEKDYADYKLDTNVIKVDAFAILYDVSHVNGRSLPYQTSEVLQLLHASLKSKKPVFLLASKCDQAEVAAFQEFRNLVQRKDLQKYPNFHWAEVSSIENVNCAEFLYELARIVDKPTSKSKIPAFVESRAVRKAMVDRIRADFKDLLRSVLPREEYPLRHGNLKWRTVLEDFSEHPALVAYIAEFGSMSSQQLYEEHLASVREYWINRELNESLPALREVLRLMFNRQFLTKTSWEQLIVELNNHPHYNNYFRPFGKSLDKFSHSFDVDNRIPSEILQKAEARQLFQNFQRQLLDEIALQRQTDKFKKLLNEKEIVTPGRSFADLKVMCQEVAEFEKALPAEYAGWIYNNYQKDLKNKAQHDFNELLLESVWLFIDLVVEWRLKQAGDSNRVCSLTEREHNIICSTLIEDKRFRDMNGLVNERKDLISKFASFMSMPLTCFCIAGERCADALIASIVADIRHDANKFCTIDAEVYGNEALVDEFLGAVKLILSSDKLFHHNDKTAKINCRQADKPHNSLEKRRSRVQSPVVLLDTIETATDLLGRADTLFITGPSPIFLTISGQNLRLQEMARQLADRFNGVFIGLNNSAYNMDISRQLMPSSFSQGQIQQTLHEICASQMGTNYADLRIRISFLCDDPFSISQVLSPLLEHTVQTDDTGGCFCVDVALPEEEINVRVSNHTGSYHHWLMAKWNLNAFNGHILIYSPVRLASWRHAEAAVQLLLEAATVAGPPSSNILERQCMGRSILLLAVEDPSNYFKNEDSNQLLREGAQLAEKTGCRFMALGPSMPHGAQFQLYSEFFGQLLHNQPLPNLPYTVCAPNQSSFAIKRRPTYFSANATTFTGSASTLLSSSSRESNLSTNCAVDSKSNYTDSRHSPRKSIDRTFQQVSAQIKNANKVELLNSSDKKLNGHRSSSRNSTTFDRKASGDSDNSQKFGDMSNRLRRPLSAIGSFMSGGGLTSHTESSPSNEHQGSSNSIAPIETHSNKIKFSPSGFRKLFQRNTAASESAASEEQSRKKLHRSSTVGSGKVVDNDSTPPIQLNGCRLEVVPASPQNSYTSYVHVIDSDGESPPLKSQAKRPVRPVLKSLSMDTEDSPPIMTNGSHAVRFATDSENIPQRTDTIVNKISDDYERRSRLRRFADRFRHKNRVNSSPKRRKSLPPKRLGSLTTSSPTSSSSPIEITYESECLNGEDIPTFLRQAIVYIERNGGLILEGLYRLSGHPGLINELERQYRKTGMLCVDKLVDNSRGSRETALIAVSAALKRYLQSFNEPLIPSKLNEELIEITSDRIDIDDHSPFSTRSLDSIRRLFQTALPRVNARILAFICAHLERVSSNSDRNKMTTKNLSLIWAGTFFRLPPSTPIMEATERMQKLPILVFFFIKHYSVLFL